MWTNEMSIADLSASIVNFYLGSCVTLDTVRDLDHDFARNDRPLLENLPKAWGPRDSD